MANILGLTKTQIVDKNGRITYVYRKRDGSYAFSRQTNKVIPGYDYYELHPPKMKAPNITTHLSDVNVGDSVELGYGYDYRRELEKRDPSCEARAFREIEYAGITGVAKCTGIKKDESGHDIYDFEVALKNDRRGTTLYIPLKSGYSSTVESLSDILGSITYDVALFEDFKDDFDGYVKEAGYAIQGDEWDDSVRDVARQEFQKAGRLSRKLRNFVGDEDFPFLVHNLHAWL